MSGPVQLIHFADRALEVVIPASCEETLRRHAQQLAVAASAIVRAAQIAACDPAEDSPSLVLGLLRGGEFLVNTSVLLHGEADRIGLAR